VDLIILDLMMPVMGGYETLTNIRKTPSLNTIPVIIVSAMNRKEDMEECFKMGAADYFTKPLKQDDVRFLVPLKVKNLIKLKLTQEKLVQAEKLAGVACLAAGMAHEINNPLGGILQNLQLLEGRLNLTIPKTRERLENYGFGQEELESLDKYFSERKIYNYLSHIKDAGERAAKIVRNLLNFSRPGERELKLCDVNSLVENAVDLAGKEYEIKKSYDFDLIKIEKYYGENISLFCEAYEITQVLLNIIKNAAYELYRFKKIKSDFEPCIKVKTYTDENYGVIQVTDNGPGISEDVKDRIFDTFFTTKEIGEGTGLGLSVSYFIVKEIHKGNLRFESEEGKGTAFFVEIPLNEVL